jgi:hypothetical protein
MGIPVETETLGLVAYQLDLRVELANGGRGNQGVLGAVKDENFAIDAKGSNNVGVLWLIAGLVHFSGVFNLVHNVAFDGCDIAGLSIPADFTTFLIIVIRVRGNGLWDLHIGNLEVVGAVIGGVSS